MTYDLVKTLIQKPRQIIDFSDRSYFQFFLINEAIARGDNLGHTKGEYQLTLRIWHWVEEIKPQMEVITIRQYDLTVYLTVLGGLLSLISSIVTPLSNFILGRFFWRSIVNKVKEVNPDREEMSATAI